jgi:N-acyl-D-amino-acid deacylase
VATLKIIDEAREEGLEVDFDVIPHHLAGGISTSPWLVHVLQPWLNIAGSPEQLSRALRMKEFREEIKDSLHEGKHYYFNPNINPDWASQKTVVECVNEDYLEKTIAEIAEEKEQEEVDALFMVLVDDPYTRAVRTGNDDWVKLEFYKHPNMMIGVDTFAVDECRESWHKPPSYPNQNSYGGFPRFLRRAVRETGTLSLEEAVRKITGNPARKFRLKDRGSIREGAWADITVFNPETIADQGTQLEPRQYPVGVEYVLVNGVIEYDTGKQTGARQGKILVNGT